VAFEEESRRSLRSEAQHAAEPKTVLPDGSYSTGPRVLTDLMAARFEHCLVSKMPAGLYGSAGALCDHAIGRCCCAAMFTILSRPRHLMTICVLMKQCPPSDPCTLRCDMRDVRPSLCSSCVRGPCPVIHEAGCLMRPGVRAGAPRPHRVQPQAGRRSAAVAAGHPGAACGAAHGRL
jgi:hypothetical protein